MDRFSIEGLQLLAWRNGFVAGLIAAVVLILLVIGAAWLFVPAPEPTRPAPDECKPRLTGTLLPCIRRVWA